MAILTGLVPRLAGLRAGLVIVLALMAGASQAALGPMEEARDSLARGQVLAAEGRSEQALTYFLFALESAEQAHGAESPHLLLYLNALGQHYARASQLVDAERYFTRAVAIQDAALTEFRTASVQSLLDLGSLYEATQRDTEADALYRRVVGDWGAALGEENPAVITARLRLAALTGNFGLVIGHYQGATITPAPAASAGPAGAPQPAAPKPAPPQLVVAKPTPAPAPAQAAAYRIHLASVQDKSRMQEEWAVLLKRFPRLLGGLEISSEPVDLGKRGLWHRIYAGPLGREEARKICKALARRDQWCRASRAPRTAAAPTPAPEPAPGPAPAPHPAPGPAPTGTSRGDYQIHLISLRDAAGAAGEWRQLQGRFRDLLGDLDYNVVRTDLGAKGGIWYRIYAGPLARGAARELCDALTRRDVWCQVTRIPRSAALMPREAALRRRVYGRAGATPRRGPEAKV